MEVAERVERNLKIVGVTAIEDKLQDDVARCISSLHAVRARVRPKLNVLPEDLCIPTVCWPCPLHGTLWLVGLFLNSHKTFR